MLERHRGSLAAAHDAPGPANTRLRCRELQPHVGKAVAQHAFFFL